MLYRIDDIDLFLNQKTIENLYDNDFSNLRRIIRYSLDSKMYQQWYKYSSYVNFFSRLSSWLSKQVRKNNSILNPRRKRYSAMTKEERELVDWNSNTRSSLEEDPLERAKYRFYELKHEKAKKNKRAIVLMFLKKMGFTYIDYQGEGVGITSWVLPKEINRIDLIEFFIFLAGAEIHYSKDESKDYLRDPKITYCLSLNPDHESTTLVVHRNKDVSSQIMVHYLDEEQWEGTMISKGKRERTLWNVFQEGFYPSRDSTILNDYYKIRQEKLNEYYKLKRENAKLKSQIKELE